LLAALPLDSGNVTVTQVQVTIATQVDEVDLVFNQKISDAGSDDGGSHEQRVKLSRKAYDLRG
jgi:hypothetical protein